jgi:hypothetical protein
MVDPNWLIMMVDGISIQKLEKKIKSNLGVNIQDFISRCLHLVTTLMLPQEMQFLKVKKLYIALCGLNDFDPLPFIGVESAFCPELQFIVG